MLCKNCGGALVMQTTTCYSLNENGRYDSTLPTSGKQEVVCVECQARHEYEEIHQQLALITIALTVNSDPKPAVTIAIGFRGGVVDEIGAKRFVGLIAIDEDLKEVGMFLAGPRDPDPWLDRAWELVKRIKKSEWSASFAEEEQT